MSAVIKFYIKEWYPTHKHTHQIKVIYLATECSQFMETEQLTTDSQLG